MSETSYQKVFEVIQSSLVPKSQYDESQKEVASLKSELESVKNEWKSKFEEQKLALDILQAEKESVKSEKKAFENKFKEVSLKLKQKTNQYDSLLKSTETCSKETLVTKVSICTQTVKEEPTEIGVVNIPTSSTSRPEEPVVKTGTKRCNSDLGNDKRRTSKRIKTSKSDNSKRTTRKSAQIDQRFSCIECIEDWAFSIKRLGFSEDPTQSGAPNPQQKIATFPSFEDYRDHRIAVHFETVENYVADPCKDKSCLEPAHHDSPFGYAHHGDIICKFCGLSFKLKKRLDWHMRHEHADINSMDNNEIYKLYKTIYYS